VALPKFRERLADGRRQSTRSRLSTYFVGALVLDFPNIYRSGLARWSRSAAEAPLDLLGAFDISAKAFGSRLGRVRRRGGRDARPTAEALAVGIVRVCFDWRDRLLQPMRLAPQSRAMGAVNYQEPRPVRAGAGHLDRAQRNTRRLERESLLLDALARLTR
jgi:hypothetical protein